MIGKEFQGTWSEAQSAACSCAKIYWVETMEGYGSECTRCGALVVYMDEHTFQIYPGKSKMCVR